VDSLWTDSPMRLRSALRSPFLGPRARRLLLTSQTMPASAQVPHCGRRLSPGGSGLRQRHDPGHHSSYRQPESADDDQAAAVLDGAIRRVKSSHSYIATSASDTPHTLSRAVAAVGWSRRPRYCCLCAGVSPPWEMTMDWRDSGDWG
jgi:hypothetical protein